jgi:hypothetical protein
MVRVELETDRSYPAGLVLALTILYWNPDTTEWEPITLPKSILLDRARGVISALVTHFSVYSVHYAHDRAGPVLGPDQVFRPLTSLHR